MSQAIFSSTNNKQLACFVYQQAIVALLQWTGTEIPSDCQVTQHDAVAQAQELLGWGTEIDRLRLVFDQIHLRQGASAAHYVPLRQIEDCNPPIPYPSTGSASTGQIESFQRTLRQDLLPQLASNWNNFAWLAIALDKYGGCVSYGDASVALVDLTRMVAAVAVAIASSPDPEQVCLIAGDLSGIQKFIYTITSSGALRSLRARSFYLELVTEEVVQQLLEALDLPRSSVIYAGGGNFYLLAPLGAENQVNQQVEAINLWLLQDFQGKIFLSLTCQSCPTQYVASAAFTQTWNRAIEQVNRQKRSKFLQQINRILEPRRSYTPCKVCHRDDQRRLYRLNPQEPNSVEACVVCHRMSRLGGQLLRVEAIVRSRSPRVAGAFDRLRLHLPGQVVYYHLFEAPPDSAAVDDVVFLVNNWNLSNYATLRATPLLLGNYGASDSDGFMTAQEFADCARSEGSIARVGYLRMDVDRLGQIFAQGLGDRYSLVKLAGLSRQMSYFFKVYLNSLAQSRQHNFIEQADQHGFRTLTPNNRRDLLFIYAGGDDLFVSGSWNQIVEFAFDVYQSFRAYTGNHPDITLSGGISIEDIKFPLYQAAAESGEAEATAKSNGRDSLGLFGSAFKWNEWLGADQPGRNKNQIIAQVREEELDYWARDSSDQPALLGILPFVSRIRSNFSRSFIQNLLIAAELQEQTIREIKEKRKCEEYQHHLQDIQYYLHLPQIAYTLSRLPRCIREDARFEPVRTSLKSPYNAPYFRAIATWIELLTRNS